jgi:WD40 repeat protein
VTSVPDSPYKGLSAFDDSDLDALFFFGREREIEAVTANVLASRLTVLFGPSGVGKSSLLRAGVARKLRERSDAPVVVHGAWAEDPAGGLITSVRAECGGLGATAGLVDTVAAAAAHRGGPGGGELYLVLDQFEEYVLYHGASAGSDGGQAADARPVDDAAFGSLGGPLTAALPELLRRPGLRVNVLIAIRDDALAELDEFTARIPELFANLLRLDQLDRDEGRAAILGPLERYSELSGTKFAAEDGLVEAVLDEASTANGIEAAYLQLVLERLWELERAEGSTTLRLTTFQRIGGSRAVVDEHVHRALEQLSRPEQEAAARVVRQLVTPSGRKLSHEAGDLAEYAAVEPGQLRDLLEELGRRRIVRGVEGAPGAAPRYEIFHDVLGPPLLAWQHEQQLRHERERAAQQRRRLRTIAVASFAGFLLVAFLAAFALIQRSNAQTQARQAHGRELAARALAGIATNPQASVALALSGAKLAPGSATASVLRSSLLAMREERVIRLGGDIVFAAFAPRGDRALVASSNGKLLFFNPKTGRSGHLDGQALLTTAAWRPDGEAFATGSATGDVVIRGSDSSRKEIRTGSAITALAFARKTLLIASGREVRLADLVHGGVKMHVFKGAVVAAAFAPNGRTFAVAFQHGTSTRAELVNARTGRMIRVLPEGGIRSFAFSPNGKLLASGSYDLTARIWNASTGRLLHVLPHKGYVLQESFSSDGRELVTSNSDGAAYVWSVATGQRELLLVDATGAIDAAAFSPDGSEIATASTDRLARIYGAINGKLLADLAGHTNAVTSVSFDPSGRLLMTGSTDGTARIWDSQPAGTLTTIDTRPGPVQTYWLGNQVVSVSGRAARLLTTSGRVLQTLTMPAPIIATAIRGSRFAFLDAAGSVAKDWSGGLAFNPDLHITAIAYEPNGTLLGAADGKVMTTGGDVVANVGDLVLSLAAGGQRFIVRTASAVAVYADDGTLVSTIHAATDHATLAPGGLDVATTKGKTAQLWDATTGRLRHTLVGHRSGITDVEYSPNGREILTVSYDHTGLIWSTRSGLLLHRLIGHFFPVYSGSYSPGGNWIVTASQYTAGLWSAATGQLMFYVGRTTAPLTGASFSPTGNWIVTGSEDGATRVYECQVCAPLGRLEQLAAQRLRRLSG